MKRSVLLIGLDQKNQILLHHKTPDAPNNANLWVMLGGAIEAKEEPQQAIERELKEELGLSLKPIFFKKYLQAEPWGTIERYIFYSPILQSSGELKPLLKEGDDLDFFTLKEMAGLSMNESHYNIIKDFTNSVLKF